MEKKIRAYEKWIEREFGRKMDAKERAELVRLHCEMVRNFQHERLIHLIVTLFFALLAVVAVAMVGWMMATYGVMAEMVPLYLLASILVVLTGFYVKHYYFLENHVQGLYKYMEKGMYE